MRGDAFGPLPPNCTAICPFVSRGDDNGKYEIKEKKKKKVPELTQSEI